MKTVSAKETLQAKDVDDAVAKTKGLAAVIGIEVISALTVTANMVDTSTLDKRMLTPASWDVEVVGHHE